MDKKKMMITAGIMAAGYGIYQYFKKNPAKLNMMKQKVKTAVNNFEDEMMM